MKKTSILIAMFAVIAAASTAKAQIAFDGENHKESTTLRETVNSFAQENALSIPIPERSFPEASESSFNRTTSADKNIRIYSRRRQPAFREQLLAKAAAEGNTEIVNILQDKGTVIMFDTGRIYLLSAQLENKAAIQDARLASDFGSSLSCDSRGKCHYVTKLVRTCTGGWIGAVCVLWDFVEILVEVCTSLPTDPNPSNEPHGNCVMDGIC